MSARNAGRLLPPAPQCDLDSLLAKYSKLPLNRLQATYFSAVEDATRKHHLRPTPTNKLFKKPATWAQWAAR